MLGWEGRWVCSFWVGRVDGYAAFGLGGWMGDYWIGRVDV